MTLGFIDRIKINRFLKNSTKEESNLISRLKEFVHSHILNDEKRLVVALERKGVTLLLALSDSELRYSRIISFRVLELNPDILKDVDNVILFDDVSWTGNALDDAVAEIKKIIANVNNSIKLSTACFFYNRERDSIPDIFPDKDAPKSISEFTRDISCLLDHLMNIGEPLNIDHIIADIKIGFGSNFNQMMAILSKKGKLYSTYCNEINNIDYIGLDDPIFYDIYKCDNDKPSVYVEGVVKIRLNRIGNIVRVIPMVYPIVIKDNDFTRSQCGYRKIWTETNFCESMKGYDSSSKGVTKGCYYCLSFNFALDLLRRFFYELASSDNLKWKYRSINEIELNTAYAAKECDFWKKIHESLSTISKDDDQPRNSHYKPSEKIKVKSPRTYPVHKPLFNGEELNDMECDDADSPLVDWFESSSWPQWSIDEIPLQVGALVAITGYERWSVDLRETLSFSEILESFKGILDYSQVSRSIDYLFDRGFLKPAIREVDVIKGERLFSAFARTYKHSGEVVLNLLRAYSDFSIE